MPYFVAVTDSPAGDDVSIERAVLNGMRVEKVSWRDPHSLVAAVQEADAILCMHAPFSEQVISHLRRCKVIARFGTGLDNIDQKSAESAGIRVVGTHGYCTEEVANHTMALILAWNRRLRHCHQFVLDRRWNERHQTTGNWGCSPMARLSSQTLGVLGLGRIGTAVAERARAFGMTVVAWNRHPDVALAKRIGVQLTSRENVLGRADYLSLHMPLSEETKHVIGRESIQGMKFGAVLVNTARGALVDEGALVEALVSGRLGGALLDVFEQAPLPAESALRGLSNVMLSPHVAFYSEESLAALRRLTAEAALRHLTGPQ